MEGGVSPPYCCGNGKVLNCMDNTWELEDCDETEEMGELCLGLACP
jgi:hypothetical protein